MTRSDGLSRASRPHRLPAGRRRDGLTSTTFVVTVLRMKRSAELSKTEWQVMNVCWQLGQATARQVYEASDELKRRDYRTVKTLLDRIAAKGFLKTEKLGPLVLFEPAVDRRSTQGHAVREFVDRVLDSSLVPLVHHLAERGDMREDEARVLRELLARLEEQDTEDG